MGRLSRLARRTRLDDLAGAFARIGDALVADREEVRQAETSGRAAAVSEWRDRQLDRAPSVRTAGQALERVGNAAGQAIADPFVRVADLARDPGALITSDRDRRRRSLEGTTRRGPYGEGALDTVLGVGGDIRQVGHGLAMEPLVYGANRLAGVETEGPFSGRNVAAANEAARRRGGIEGLAARLGLAALGEGTDPTNYLIAPAKGGTLARTALRTGAGALAFGAGAEAAGEGATRGAKALGASDETAGIVGLGAAFLGGGLASYKAENAVKRLEAKWLGETATVAGKPGLREIDPGSGTAATARGGTPLGMNLPGAGTVQALGGLTGAAYGSTQGETPEERAFNVMLYGGLGAAIGVGGVSAARLLKMSQAAKPGTTLYGGLPVPGMGGPRVRAVPLGQIDTRPDLFQARDVDAGKAISEPRVQRLVERIQQEGFDPQQGTITVVKDPEQPGRFIVLAGHHRLEAAKRLGRTDIPVIVDPADISTDAGRQAATRRAIAHNFAAAENNVADRVNTAERLAAMGLDEKEIAATMSLKRGEVERTLDVARLGPGVVARLVAEKHLEPLAAEIGRGMRLYGIAQSDAAGLFQRAVLPDARGQIATPSALRDTITVFGKQLADAPVQASFLGMVEEGTGHEGLLRLIDEHTRTLDDIARQQRALTRQRNAVKTLASSGGPEAAAAGATLVRQAEARLTELQAQRTALEEQVKRALRQGDEAGAAVAAAEPAGPLPGQGDIFAPPPPAVAGDVIGGRATREEVVPADPHAPAGLARMALRPAGPALPWAAPGAAPPPLSLSPTAASAMQGTQMRLPRPPTPPPPAPNLTLQSPNAPPPAAGPPAPPVPPARPPQQPMLQPPGGTPPPPARGGFGWRAPGIGSGVGAAAGFFASEEDADWQTRLRNAAIGAGVGAGGVLGAKALGKGTAATYKGILGDPGDPTWRAEINRLDGFIQGRAPRLALETSRGPIAGVPRVLGDEIAAGRVTETPARKAAMDQRIAELHAQAQQANAVGNAELAAEYTARAERVQQARLSPVAVAEEPGEYVLSQPARGALTVYQDAQAAQLAREAAHGVKTHSTVPDYVMHAYTNPPSSGRAGKRRLDQRQAFQNARTHPTYLDAIANGLVPKSDNLVDLQAARVLAGETAIALRQTFDRVKADPDVFWTPGPKKGSPPPGFRRANEVLSRRLIALFDTDDLNLALDELNQGVLTPGQASQFIRSTTGAAEIVPWLRDDVATMFEKYLGPDESGEFFRKLHDVAGLARTARLSADIVMPVRIGLPSLVQASAHPAFWKGFGVLGKAFRDSVGQGEAIEPRLWLNPKHAAAIDALGLAKGNLSEVVAVSDRALLKDHLRAQGGPSAAAARVLDWLGDKYTFFERWQFGQFIPALKVNLYESLVEQMSKGGRRVLSEDELTQIAYRVNTLTTGVSRAMAGTSRMHEANLRLGFLSPAWFRAPVRQLAAVTQKDMEGALARRFWAGLGATAVATSVASAIAFSDDELTPDDVARLLDPTSPESVTNPNSKRFLQVTMPGGGEWSPWGTVTPTVRALLRPAAQVGEEFTKALAAERAEGDNWLNAAIDAGVAAGVQASIRYPKSAVDWGEARRAVLPGVAFDLAVNENFRGRPIATADTETEQWKQRGLYAAAQFTPSLVGPALGLDGRTALPKWGVSDREAWKTALAQATIGTYTPPADDPALVKEQVANFLRSQGKAATLDPVGTYRRLKAQDELNVLAVGQFEDATPAVRDYLLSRRVERGREVGPFGKEAFTAYSGAVARVKGDRDRQLQDLDARYTAPGSRMSGSEWRKERGQIRHDASVKMQMAAQSYLNVETLDEAAVKIDRILGRDPRTKEQRVTALLDAYYAIEPADQTRAAREQFFAERRAYLDDLKARDPQAHADLTAMLRVGLTPVEREYQQALDQMDGARLIPSYLGPDAATGRNVTAALGRARDIQRATGVPLKVAVLMDEGTDDTTKAWALRAAKGRLKSNPDVRQFWLDHPLLTKYFSDLALEDVGRLTA